MANVRFLWKNYGIDPATTITSTSDAAPQYAAISALANFYRLFIWRSGTSTGDQHVDFAMGGPITLTGVAAINYKVHGNGGTLKAQWSNGGAFTDFGTFPLPSPNRTNMTVVYGNQPGVTVVRFLFTNTAAFSDYVELGVGFICDLVHDFTPKGYLQNARKTTVADPSPTQYAVGGQKSTYIRPMYLEPELSFPALNSADFTTIVDKIHASVGTGVPIVVDLRTLNYKIDGELLYGYMPATVVFSGLNAGQKGLSAVFEEAR